MNRKLFDSFTNQKKVQFANGNGPNAVQNGFELAEIETLYSGLFKYRADVRLLTGEKYKKIRLPGPYYGITGFFSGHKHGFKTGQLCLIGFIQNRRDNPIILAIYPFPAGVSTQTNLSKNLDYDSEEVSSGHESGHKTVWTENLLKHVDKLNQIRFQIDLSIPPTVNKLEHATQGETLKKKLEDLIDILLEISNALSSLTVNCTAPGNPSLPPNNLSAFISASNKLNSLKTTLPQILSEVIKHF